MENLLNSFLIILLIITWIVSAKVSRHGKFQLRYLEMENLLKSLLTRHTQLRIVK